jgi:outer membrane protein OmpA-like peptidoglycan-associated protein
MSSVSAADAVAAVRSSTTMRYTVRRDFPVWPFIWRGLLPLLGLVFLGWYALSPFARDSMEGSVRHNTRAALDRAGFLWVDVKVSGQDVLLTGPQPNPGAGVVAVELARQLSCPTWLGPQTCAVRVDGQFTDPIAPPPAPAPAAMPAELTPAQAAPPAAAQSPAAAAQAQACEADLAGLLAQSQILFGTGSARIKPESQPLIDKLAVAAGTCPGHVRVEGHTDNVGAVADNQRLSEARATAVMEALIARGMPHGRVSAQGLGPSQPKADNASAEGRAQNRRIEFKAVLNR